MRKDILIICLFLFISSTVAFSQEVKSEINNQINTTLTGHPRLFFLTSDEAILKAKLANTPILNRTHNVIIAESNKMLNYTIQKRVIKGGRLLIVCREALRRITFLSYAYRMTGNTSYAARAEQEMLGMASFTDWNPVHFLDVAEMTMSMAIGYDWLYNYLSVSSRAIISSAIKTKGIERTIGANANQWWMTTDNNWSQVCNAGISAGVASVYDENPVYYQTLIDKAINSIKVPMGVYVNNGGFPEGYGYWSYGTTYNILFLDMLERMWGTDSGLSNLPGFMNTGNFITHMQGNATKKLNGNNFKTITPQPFNFGDNDGTEVLVGLYWLAAHSLDKSILYSELQKIDFMLTNNDVTVNNNSTLPFLLIWSRDLSLTDLPAPTETTYTCQGGGALAVMRSGWAANDIYLGLKGGTPSQNHAHMDIGSFVMEAMDVRWAMDFGASNYSVLESNGVDLWNMGQYSSRWDAFRYNNMAHNTLTFNGNYQMVAGNSPIENFVNTANLKSAELNLTPIYKNDVNYCKRSASIVLNRYVEIKDVVQAKTNQLSVRWNMLTQAIPTKISDKIIRLTQSDKILYLIFEGTDAVSAKRWSTTPSTTYEETNTGTYFTGFEYIIPSGASSTVTVSLVPDGDPKLNGLDLTANGSVLNESFESFDYGTLTNGFTNWLMDPKTGTTLLPILGEVSVNPFKSGINTSDKALKITRQDNTAYITTANAANLTYRGAQAYGYDLRLNTNSILEFKYYKDVTGVLGIRLYDGKGNVVLIDFTDPYEKATGYTTAQWRTAQFALSNKDLSLYNFTPSGYLLISLERIGTESAQEKQLVLYLDDVKLLPFPSSTDVENISENPYFKAFYDGSSQRICVTDLPDNTTKVRLFDLMGRLLSEVQVSGKSAMLSTDKLIQSIYIVQAMASDGSSRQLKIIPNYIR